MRARPVSQLTEKSMAVQSEHETTKPIAASSSQPGAKFIQFMDEPKRIGETNRDMPQFQTFASDQEQIPVGQPATAVARVLSAAARGALRAR